MELAELAGEFEVIAWHPETARDQDGVSLFDPHDPASAPRAGRTMVVLRRL
jgi:hypothetical protein